MQRHMVARDLLSLSPDMEAVHGSQEVPCFQISLQATAAQ